MRTMILDREKIRKQKREMAENKKAERMAERERRRAERQREAEARARFVPFSKLTKVTRQELVDLSFYVFMRTDTRRLRKAFTEDELRYIIDNLYTKDFKPNKKVDRMITKGLGWF